MKLKSFLFYSDQHGQALVEYLMVLIFISFLAGKMVTGFSDFFRDSFGNLGHALSINLNVGVCERDCFFGGYKNGYKK
jgi:hypothetical protein